MITVEQVESLSPDAASIKRARGLATERHWVSLGVNEDALWGECQGSGKKPYRTQVALSDYAAKCSCPSRKFPCKHALALMLLAASQASGIKKTSPPDWVAEWIKKRATREEAKAAKAKPKTEKELKARKKAAERRAKKREALADEGIQALQLWLKDLAHLGLADIKNLPPSVWEDQAARMVDSKLPGAARLIREMAQGLTAQTDWPARLLLRLGRLFLLTRAYENRASLSDPEAAEVRSLLGWTITQDELIENQPAVADDWLVCDVHIEEDSQTGLKTQIAWLWGRETRQPAQILNFAYRNQLLDISLVTGRVFRSDLVYYPGAFPLRAVFKDKKKAGPTFVPAGYKTLSAFLSAYADMLGRNPWIEDTPVILEGVTPMFRDDVLYFCDPAGAGLPLPEKYPSGWSLFSLSGGAPLTVFALWDGWALLPKTAWLDGREVAL
jgi:hypothetical protein